VAGVTEYVEYDAANKRTCVQWTACGIEHRANIVEADGQIPLHEHSYPHVALVTEGSFDVVEITKDGERKEYIAAAKMHPDAASSSVGYRLVIPAWHQHTFKPRGVRGEVLCLRPEPQ
jgi:hypothetical protein